LLHEFSESHGRARRSRLRYVVPVLVALPFLAIAAGLLLVASSKPAIQAGGRALATVRLPRGGGQVVRVIAIGGREQQVLPVRLEGDQVVPTERLAAGERITVQATIRRPGWISWLTGSDQQVQVSETTPAAHLTSAFVTHRAGQPVMVDFSSPVAELGTAGAAGSPMARALPRAIRSYALDETSTAGTAELAVAARSWEKPETLAVTWFPAGTRATAVASPAPGSRITPDTRITLTFSRPVAKVLDGQLPPLTPRSAGAWHKLDAHTIQFVPTGYGYGLGADVRVSLPSAVSLQGGQVKGSDPVGQWTVPNGSTLALQQLLAQLGYLPVTFTPATGSPVASSAAAEEAAVANPPQGKFGWKYPHTPPQLRALWKPGSYGELTKGAVMAFEQDQGLPTDGIAGPDVWRTLINAAVTGQDSKFGGYTFVMVSEHTPETIRVWHNGKIVVSGLANTGIPASPTATGTYAVYERMPVGTMSGTNPNGTPYHDTGIPWISYFNGGDALHGFIRASYGFPQSLGCVEMPFSEAGAVYPYTPIGTLVQIAA
jgi:lipoprotein-anchoring transpeptidase ErfK/SrfK